MLVFPFGIIKVRDIADIGDYGILETLFFSKDYGERRPSSALFAFHPTMICYTYSFRQVWLLLRHCNHTVKLYSILWDDFKTWHESALGMVY